jgi:drug/metabolite transporter (DMT)-like permease
MLAASGLFSAMFAMVKALGPGFPNTEAAFFRALLSLPLMAALLWRSRRSTGLSLRPARPALMAARGLFGCAAMLGFFYALPRGKLADLMIISRTQPIFITILARVILGERASRLALACLVGGFAGAFLVIKPGLGWLNLPAAIALGAAVLSALAHLAVRQLNATDPPLLIVLYFTLIVGTCSGLLSIPVFVVPDLRQLLLLVALAQCAAFGQLLMTTAYGRDTAPVVAASAYAIVLYGLLLGYLLWGEMPDGMALLGGVLIVGAGVVLAFARRGMVVPPSVS